MFRAQIYIYFKTFLHKSEISLMNFKNKYFVMYSTQTFNFPLRNYQMLAMQFNKSRIFVSDCGPKMLIWG